MANDFLEDLSTLVDAIEEHFMEVAEARGEEGLRAHFRLFKNMMRDLEKDCYDYASEVAASFAEGERVREVQAEDEPE